MPKYMEIEPFTIGGPIEGRFYYEGAGSLGRMHPKSPHYQHRYPRLTKDLGDKAAITMALSFTNFVGLHVPGNRCINRPPEAAPKLTGHLRAEGFHDGLVVVGSNVWAGFYTGDSNALVGWGHKEDGTMGMVICHLGLRCMYRKPEDEAEKGGMDSVIKTTLRAAEEQGLTMKGFRIGWGIGPCCYGFDTVDVGIQAMQPPNINDGKVLRGPLVDKKPISLRDMAYHQLIEELGVPVRIVSRNTFCTACGALGLFTPAAEGGTRFSSHTYTKKPGKPKYNRHFRTALLFRINPNYQLQP